MTRTARPIKHGTVSAYNHRGCRCDLCRAANRRQAYKGRAARIAQLVVIDGVPTAPVRKHGNVSTYGNWYCRCAPCCAAWSEYMAAYRARNQTGRVGYPHTQEAG
jgi:hypothetical protein